MAHITIYSKDGCPNCTKAIDYAHGLVGEDVTRVINNPSQEIVNELKSTHHHYTYPFVFVGTRFVGGYTDLVEGIDDVLKILNDQFGFEEEF